MRTRRKRYSDEFKRIATPHSNRKPMAATGHIRISKIGDKRFRIVSIPKGTEPDEIDSSDPISGSGLTLPTIRSETWFLRDGLNLFIPVDKKTPDTRMPDTRRNGV